METVTEEDFTEWYDLWHSVSTTLEHTTQRIEQKSQVSARCDIRHPR